MIGENDQWSFGNAHDAPIGIGSLTDNSEYVNGAMDDIRIYNYAFSPVEVAAMYHEVTGQMPCVTRPALDFTGDCTVGMDDFAYLATWWLYDGLYQN